MGVAVLISLCGGCGHVDHIVYVVGVAILISFCGGCGHVDHTVLCSGRGHLIGLCSGCGHVLTYLLNSSRLRSSYSSCDPFCGHNTTTHTEITLIYTFTRTPIAHMCTHTYTYMHTEVAKKWHV